MELELLCAAVIRTVRERLATRQTPWWLPGGVGPMPPAGLPNVVYDDALTLHFADEEVELLHFGPAHTDGDTIVWFKNAGVVHVGDLFHGLANPAAGGDMGGVALTLSALLSRLPAATTVVTGHGPVVDRAELEEYYRMLDATLVHVKRQLAAGVGRDAIVAGGLPAPWDRTWQGSERALAMWLEAIYRGLTAAGGE